MIIKQISVFIENRPGRLAEVTSVIAENGINMRALMLAENKNSGILRIIADEPDKFEKVLKSLEMRYSVNEVLAVLVEDKAGSLAALLKMLAGNNIALRYMYAFTAGQKKACLILRISEEFRPGAVEILKKAGYGGLNDDIFG
jgi:hypothetical protein